MEQSNDVIRLVQIMIKWKKTILFTVIAVAVGACLLTWFCMPNYYKSTANFYPSNPIMTDRQVLYSESAGEIKIDYFGSAGDIDRILTIANTSAIIDYIINKYHLMDHYGYDSTKEMSRYNTKKKFLKNYSAVETEYGAIEISVWDRDKNLASDIANHIVTTIDDRNKEMLLRDKHLVIEAFKKDVASKEVKVAALNDTISTLKQRGASPETLLIFDERLKASVDDLNKNQMILEQNETAANTDFSTVHVTEPAYPAIRKDRPTRSLIVAGITIGMFFFMVILAVLTENYRLIKNKLKNA